MNKTTFQNGASSQSPLYGHRSTPDTPTSQPQGGSLANSSSKHSSVADTPASNYKIRECEMFQSREVLLKMLQSSPVVYVPGSGCSLPHQVDGKACSKSDGSHCSRCINFQPPHSMVHVNSELTNEQFSPVTKNGMCVPPPNIGDQQSISYRETGEKHFQPHRGIANVPCDEENLLRKRSFEKTRLLFPATARCRTCEGSSQPFYPEELHLRAACCQHFLPENQKKINRSHCFPKETLSGDRSSVPLQKERQIEDNGAIHSNRKTPRKDGDSINHRYPPFRFYRSCDSRPYQPPTSNQTLARDHPGMETSSDEVPVDVRPGECSGNDVAHNIIDRYHVVASSSTQGKPSDPSLPLPKGCSYTPSCPSDESLQDQGREERNTRIEKDFGKHNYACPHCPNPSPQEECTPVIVHCYSLSEPGSNSDSQIVNEPKSGTSHTVSERTTWIPDHSQCVHQQPPLKSHKPVNRLHLDEHAQYDAPAHRPRSNTFAHIHRFNTQPKHAMNESPTTDVCIDDEQEQNGSALMLPSRAYDNFRPPMNCRCLHCPPCPHENGYNKKCIQTARRIPYPYSKHCPEPRKSSESVSQIHISSGYHGMNTLPEADRQVDVCNGPNRPVSNGGRPTLKIRDYYEERRILVEKFYEDIQGSVEETESEENSDISYGGHHEDHRHRHPASDEVFQTPAFENSPFHIGVNQQDIVVGSRKRKNRTPRPQRVKSDDPAQFSCSEVTQDHSEESFKNRRHQQRNLSCHLGTSVPKEAWRKTREDVEVRGNENETRFCEDVQATVPAHPGWVRRCDDNFSKNTPSRSRIYRRDNSTDTRPPCHPLSEGSKSIDGCELFLEFPRVPPRNVPSFGAFSNMHHPANRFSLEHQKNTYYHSKLPQQNFVNSYEHASKRPDNFESEWNIAQEHWHTSARREGSKTHLETLGNVGTDYENGHGTCPSRMRKASFGPSQHNIPNQGKAVFQIEMEFEPEHNGEAMPGYAGRHAALTMDKHQSEDSNSSSSSLPSDHESVPSTTLEDSDVLQKTHSSDQPQEQAYAPTDGEIARKPTDEQNVTFLESSNLFLQSQEMYGNVMSPAIKERRFICRFCCKKFAHFSTLQNHVRTHTGDKPFQCKFCSRRFAQSGVLKAHLRTHTGDKPFVCMYCGKTFAQSTTLTNHLRTHTGQKPYICNYCGKSFSQPSTLRKHELSHTKERPYSCKFCGKAFAQQSTLTNHMRSHTGQRPYKCHFCEKSFAQLSTLDRHLRLHSSVIPKPHQCRYCSKSFSYVSNLASHMQVHQQEQQSQVA